MQDDQKKEPEQPSGPLAEKAAKIDEKHWLQYQTIAGAVLGAAAGALLFLVKDDGSLLPLNFIFALAIAKFLPDYLEKQMGRSLRRARIVMIVMMLVTLLADVAYILITKGPSAFTMKQP